MVFTGTPRTFDTGRPRLTTGSFSDAERAAIVDLIRRRNSGLTDDPLGFDAVDDSGAQAHVLPEPQA